MDGFLTWWSAVWDVWHTPIRIVAIILGAVIARSLLLLSVKRVIRGVISGMNGKAVVASGLVQNARVVQRAQTLGSVLNNFITWTVVLVALSSVLSELGVAVGALVAGAGILGAAVGFGAQSLVRDLISGLFIVFEDQYGVGDSVDLGFLIGALFPDARIVHTVREPLDVILSNWFLHLDRSMGHALDLEDLAHADVAKVVATLKQVGRRHLLVVQKAGSGHGPRVRGVISQTQIERQLGQPIALVETAGNFAEISATLAA